MKKIILLGICLSMFSCSLYAKKDLEKIADEIVSEGKALYNIDMAAWHGTDIMKEKYRRDVDSLGGYFSYVEEDKRICVFFSRYDFHKVYFQITLDSTFNDNNARYTDEIRPFNSLELELFSMRQKAMDLLSSDTLFEFYKNTSPNIIPLIYNGERKVYVITGTSLNNLVPLGNDYLIAFDKKLQVSKLTKIHKNLIPIQYEKEHEAGMTMHSHLASTGDFITPTDICTLMEYEKLIKMKQHLVISENYISIWDCENDKLLILTKDAWGKIADGDKK